MKRRHVLAVLGLSFVTLGIYVIYWLYKTRKELLQYLPNKSAIPPVTILFIPYFVAIASLVVGFIVSYSLAFNHNDAAANTISALTMIVFMLSVLACFVVSFWWFYKYFKAVEDVTQGNDAMLLYVVWIALTLIGFGPIWVIVVQNDLNKFIDNGFRPLKTPADPGYRTPPYQQQWQQPAYGQPMPPQHPAQWQPPAPAGQAYPQQYAQQPAAPQHNPHPAEHHQQHPHHQQHASHHEQQPPRDHGQPPQHYQG